MSAATVHANLAGYASVTHTRRVKVRIRVRAMVNVRVLVKVRGESSGQGCEWPGRQLILSVATACDNLMYSTDEGIDHWQMRVRATIVWGRL